MVYVTSKQKERQALEVTAFCLRPQDHKGTQIVFRHLNVPNLLCVLVHASAQQILHGQG